MPTVRSNGFYNSPAFAQAASNLSALFEPPSGADAAGWATAKAKREEAQRLQDFFDYQKGSDFDTAMSDRIGIGAGVFAPNQSMRAVEMDDATKRYGFDTQAATSRSNNDANNAAAYERQQLSGLQDFYKQPLSEGQIGPAVPSAVAERAFGMPGDIAQREGREKPLSAEEQRAQFMQLLNPDEQRAVAFGNTPTANVVTPEGPRIASSLDSLGQEPYFNRGSEPKPDVVNYRAPDGRAGTAVYDSELGLVDTQNRQPLPQGTQTFKAQAQGAVDDVLGQSTQNRIDKQLIDAAVAKDVAVQLRDMIATAPASQGVIGWMRGTAQNVIATGGELGRYFGGNVDEIQKRIAQGLEEQDLAGAFDKNIPAIELMSNMLAFQYAKLQGADRLSNEMIRTARSALGLEGMTSNQQSSLARLDQAIKMIESQEAILGRARGGGVDAVGGAAPPAPTPTSIPNGGGGYPEGTVIQNAQGQKMVRRNGQWEPM